ncbi:MAG: hypothetical protein MJ213_02345 [Bacilli bacterium]|nr:hypothetical protein [Bacilli bacterium]
MQKLKIHRCVIVALPFLLTTCGNNQQKKVEVLPTSISFAFSNENAVEAGEVVSIQNVKVYPEDATNKEVAFTLDSYSSEKELAALDGDKITTINEGSVTVTAYSVQNPLVSFSKELCILPVSAKDAQLSLSSNEVTIGETVTANVSILPADTKVTRYTLFASPADAVQINDNRITPIKTGNIVLYAKTPNGVISNKVTLTSNEEVKSKHLRATSTSYHLYPGESADIAAFIGSKEVDATFTTISGTSDIISLDGSTLTAVAAGKETIRAFHNNDTTTAFLTICVEDDLFLTATPVVGGTLDYAKLTDGDVPSMLGGDHTSVIALTTNNEKYGSKYPSFTFDLGQSIDTTKESLSFDVFSDLAYNWSSVKVRDSAGEMVGKEIGKDYVSHKWTRFDIPFSSHDIRYIQIIVNYEKSDGVDSTIYLDTLNLRKGTCFTKGQTLSENSKDYRMPCYDLSTFSENQLYVEVKAEGTGDDNITFQDTLSGAWYNITGNIKLSFTDGVLTSATGYGVNCQIATLEDGWYGVFIPFKGDGAINATNLNLLYSGDKIATDAFYIDLKGIRPAIGTYVEKGSTIQVSSNAGDFNYIPYSNITEEGAYVELKVRPQGNGTIKFALMDSSWENISGTITMVVENSKVTRVYTSGTSVEKSGTFEELEDGWFAIRLTESQMQYPNGQSGTAQGFGLIYGGNSCTCDYYEIDNHSFKVTYSEDIIDPEGEDIYDEGC